MQTLNGWVANCIAGGAVLGGLPLLAALVSFMQLMEARNAGHPYSGDAIGLAIMSIVAFGIAVVSLLIGTAYFSYKRTRHQQNPKRWHMMALIWVTVEVVGSFLYFVFF
ncbi:hypothetical protein GTP46_18760 [Duganella sp. FT135W]|uniref:DUF4190 domain-containing protein n=1 Tax=Duganella flavida TaxID=2692175 RepID=A0A6L8KJJ2_9BURK|nr:hypothetical protein [Duganella flavida]MYM24681.1 hypothetical protein [Duganella flavida]